MGLKDTASLALIPAAYKTSKIYSALPTDGDGDFTFTRTGNATRVNKAGLVETMGTNIGRLNYDLTNGTPASCPSLLLEPSRTNFVSPNNSLTGYLTNGVSTTNNDTIAPNGTNEGAKVQATTSGTAVMFKGFSTTSSNATHNFSVFVKAGTHNILQIQEGFAGANIIVDLSDGTEVSSLNATNKKIEKYPNGWYRVSFNFTSNGTNLQFSIYFSGSYSSGKNYYVWGGQIEAGSYATSLIPTSGSAVTRTVDNAHLLNHSLFTDYPFTVYANAKVDAIGNTVFGLNNTSSNQYYLLFYFPNSSQVSVGRATIGLNDFDNYNFSYSVGDTMKIAVAFISATAYKLYVNGTEVADVTSGTSIPFNHNDISLGQLRITGDTGTRNSINEFMVFNEALSDSELQTLTS